MLRPQLLHSFLSSLKDAPPFFSPALLERRFPRKGRSSSWCGGHRRQGNAGLLGPTDYAAWGCRRPRGLGGSASSMDSLYVEEVAASLVREFLSRKVMAVHSEAQETALMVGGSLGFPAVPLHLPGVGEHSTPSVRLRFPQERTFFRDWETTFPRSQSFLVRGHFHEGNGPLVCCPPLAPLSRQCQVGKGVQGRASSPSLGHRACL